MAHRPPISWAIQIEQGHGDKVVAEIAHRYPIELIERLNSISSLLQRDVYIMWGSKNIVDRELYFPSVHKVEGGTDLIYNALPILPPLKPSQIAGYFFNHIPIRVLQSLGAESLRPEIKLGPIDSPFGVEGLSAGIGVVANISSISPILDAIRAKEAWRYNKGDGAIIAILDSGVMGIPESKKLAGIGDNGVSPWVDNIGHGSLAARIALAVAPNAKIISLRIDLDKRGALSSSSIYYLLDWIIGWSAANEKRVIVNMSWGVSSCFPLFLPGGILARDVARAMDPLRMGLLCHAVGNNRHVCGDSIVSAYTMATMAQSLAVGALTRTLSPQFYTARGPGPIFPIQPAVSCPTYGVLPWGEGFRDFGEQGGATSSCAPMVAGALAILDTEFPELNNPRIRAAIRMGASNKELGLDIPWHPLSGCGLLNIEESVKVAPRSGLHWTYALERSAPW